MILVDPFTCALLHRLSRCKRSGKRSHPLVTAARLRERGYRSAQEDPRRRLWRYFQSGVCQAKGSPAQPRHGGEEGQSKFEARSE